MIEPAHDLPVARQAKVLNSAGVRFITDRALCRPKTWR